MRALFSIFLWFFVNTASASAQGCGPDFEPRLSTTRSFTTENGGRLEVCRNGVWGSVRLESSTIFWSPQNVLVACQLLEYPSGLNSVPSIQLGVGDLAGPNLPVHMEGVVCNGTERSLGDCRFNVVTDSVFHGSDVYIVCLPGPENYSVLHNLLPSEVQQEAREGDVRLKGSLNSGDGIVEIYTRFGWSSICPDSSWTSADASLICENLGYDSGSAVAFNAEPALIVPRMVYDTRCTTPPGGSLLRLVAGDCSFLDNTLERSSLCPFPSNVFAGVSCRASTTTSVRLFPRTTEGNTVQGLVEVLVDSRWGLVCLPTDSTQAAASICQGLGYMRGNAEVIPSSTNRLRSRESRLKPIWYPDLICTEDSHSISDCTPVSPVGYGSCAEILAIQCETIPFRLSAGGVAGIVISVLLVVGVTLWFFLHFKPKVWDKRHGSQWFRNLTNCWESFSSCKCLTQCCTTRPPQAVSPRPRQADPVPVPEPVSEPEPDQDAQELTAPAPPTYHAAADLSSPQEELPPPYPGPSQAAYPPFSGASGVYPPPDPTSEKSPYPPSRDPAYPTGAYPPPGDPAYPTGAYPTPGDPAYPTGAAAPYPDPAYPSSNPYPFAASETLY